MINFFKRLLSMAKNVHAAVQAIATLAQFVSVVSPAVPLKYKALTVAVGSLLQAILALANHGNGGPAK